MSLMRCFSIFCLCMILSATAFAEAVMTFPCDPGLSPFLASSKHTVTKHIDLNQQHRMAIDDWESDVTMVESGSLMILDDQFMMISLRFSKNFDYASEDMHLPEEILLINQDPNIVDDTNPPLWRAVMYPDKDDPYAFHYAGTWNPTMYCIRFYGSYTSPEGDMTDCFSLHVDL